MLKPKRGQACKLRKNLGTGYDNDSVTLFREDDGKRITSYHPDSNVVKFAKNETILYYIKPYEYEGSHIKDFGFFTSNPTNSVFNLTPIHFSWLRGNSSQLEFDF